MLFFPLSPTYTHCSIASSMNQKEKKVTGKNEVALLYKGTLTRRIRHTLFHPNNNPHTKYSLSTPPLQSFISTSHNA